MPNRADLEQTLATYEALRAHHLENRARLLERRRGAADHVMVELDDRLAANRRAVDALQRAIDVTAEHLKIAGT